MEDPSTVEGSGFGVKEDLGLGEAASVPSEEGLGALDPANCLCLVIHKRKQKRQRQEDHHADSVPELSA